ncbi:MAG: AAC(3) family N-acetyltransferase [Rhodospirillales bacterium]|nr:AAC(3) family N-acetyltransferase [Rhodospirillales bacterium]
MNNNVLVTRSSLAEQLRAAGLKAGDVLLVHTALNRLGFVVGAAQTVIDALLDAVGPGGTVMMPTYSGELSDPAEWRHPPVPEDWIEPIRRETPPYDPLLTPTRRMGVTAELFRHRPGARRSPHPQSSFTAIGVHAEALVGEHPMDYRFGPASPLGKLCELGGKAVSLGAPANTNSLLYLTEHRVDGKKPVKKSAPMRIGEKAQWVPYDDVVYTNDWFAAATDFLLEQGIAIEAPLGATTCRIFPAAKTIEAVTAWRKRAQVT